jgi:hypothetical protein
MKHDIGLSKPTLLDGIMTTLQRAMILVAHNLEDTPRWTIDTSSLSHFLRLADPVDPAR